MASKTSGIGIGSLIRQYREQHQVTQRELAAAAGVSIGTLRDLEQERTRFPRWVTIEGLTAVLGLSQAERAELTPSRRTGDLARRPPSAHRTAARAFIEILGPVAAWRDGSRVPLGLARQRAVLGMLALHAGTSLHREAIIDLLWGDKPPASAVAQVQRYVSQLRRLLGDAPAGHARTETGTAGMVTTVGECCYRLNADTGRLRLDLAVFRRMTSEARDSARTDPAAACSVYEHALGLWQGDLMADVDLLRDHPAAVEVRRLRAEAVLGFAEAAVIAGAHVRTHAAAHAGIYVRVLPRLRWLCAAEPLNEQAHASLMITLAAAGQQADALQVFTEVRHHLDSELGISPGAVLVHAYAQVLRGQKGR